MTTRPQFKTLPFLEWLPDQASVGSPGIKEMNNAVPLAVGYGSIPSPADLHITGGPLKPTGLDNLTSLGRNTTTFAGDETKLYRENFATDTFDDVSRLVGGPYAGGTNLWRAIQFDDKVYYVNGVDDMQEWTLDVSANFIDAATDEPGIGGQYIAMVQDHVVIGRSKSDASGIVPNRVRWSGIRQPLSWAVDPQTRADFQDIQDFGEVRGLTGGTYMTVLMEKGIVRGDLSSGPGIFRFLDIEGALGCLSPSSVLRFLGKTYYLAEEGFRVFNGVETTSPGEEKIDRTFFNLLKPSELDRIFPFVALAQNLIGWTFVSSNSPDGNPDKGLVYNYTVDRWALVDAPFDIMARIVSPGATMDELDASYATLDVMPGTLDSRIYQNDVPFVGGLKNGVSRVLSGPPQPATIVTAECKLSPNARSMATRLDPLVEGVSPEVTVDVATRDDIRQQPVVATGYGYNDDGFIPLRDEARYHSFKVQISGNWSHATGVKVTSVPTGDR